jgi:hypothetical protein
MVRSEGVKDEDGELESTAKNSVGMTTASNPSAFVVISVPAKLLEFNLLGFSL